MAKNRVIITAGDAIKKELTLISGTATAATFVMPAAGGVAPATANYVGQIGVVDFSSIDGMNAGFDGSLMKSGNIAQQDLITYEAGDQIPILYPTNGCIINVYAVAAAYADGDLIGVGAGGAAAVVTDAATAFGVCRETVTLSAADKILVEVLK